MKPSPFERPESTRPESTRPDTDDSSARPQRVSRPEPLFGNRTNSGIPVVGAPTSKIPVASPNGSGIPVVGAPTSKIPAASPNGSGIPIVGAPTSKIPNVVPKNAGVSFGSAPLPRAPSADSADSAVSPNADVSNDGASVSSEDAPDFAALFDRSAATPARPQRAGSSAESIADVEFESPESANEFEFLREESTLSKARSNAPIWGASVVVHLLVAALLALLALDVDAKKVFELISQPGLSDEFVLDEVDDFDANEVEITNDDAFEAPTIDDASQISNFDEAPTSEALALADNSLGFDPIPVGETTDLLGAIGPSDYSGRGANKAAALASGGGSEGSEKAVALALAWLAEHQRPDGSWSYSFGECPTCAGLCSHSGSVKAPFAATAMGLLPFLAAGHTADEGKYRRVVAKGLKYLLANGERTEMGLSFRDQGGNMYSHGLATIALCEAYAMQSSARRSRNQKLAYAARDAVRYIENAQDPEGGGWRYRPRQAGDASVVGWQVMALKSARIGGIPVSENVLRGAVSFLRDKVSSEDESRYGYTSPSGGTNATTSAGLLSRIYLDWRVDNPKLLKGADRIVQTGPILSNPYYNYYATQLLHHIGGERWTRWNDATRDKLIETQSLAGHERGSWYPDKGDSYCQSGGRLYATSLNCLILEIYYRHMPLYRQQETDVDAALDLSGGD